MSPIYITQWRCSFGFNQTDKIMLITSTKHYFRRYASFFTLLLLAAACTDHEPRPETEPLPVAAVNDRLLLESGLEFGVTSVEYNAGKKPTKFEFVNISKSVEITYTANNVTYLTSEGGKLIEKKVYELENGVAKKLTDYIVDNNGNEQEQGVTTYTYKGGKLEKETYTENGQVVAYGLYFYDNAKENVSSVEVYYNGLLENKTTYEYTNIPDKSGSFNQWNLSMQGLLFPKYSKYLIKKSTYEYNGSVDVSTFSYVLDQQGYVTSAKQAYSLGGEDNWTNTWQ